MTCWNRISFDPHFRNWNRKTRLLLGTKSTVRQKSQAGKATGFFNSPTRPILWNWPGPFRFSTDSFLLWSKHGRGYKKIKRLSYRLFSYCIKWVYLLSERVFDILLSLAWSRRSCITCPFLHSDSLLPFWNRYASEHHFRLTNEGKPSQHLLYCKDKKNPAALAAGFCNSLTN